MKKIILVLVAVFMVSTFGGIAFAKLTVDISILNGDINIAPTFAPLKAQIEDKWNDPIMFSNGVGNAVVYSGQVAGLNAHQNYDLFALMIGGNLSVQTPISPTSGLTNASEDLKGGDSYSGVASSFAVNLGLNLGIIPFVDLDGFYGNIKFGSFTTPDEIGPISLKNIKNESTTFGVGVQYGIIADKSLLFGFLKWRGVSVGSGLNIISSKTTISGIAFDFTEGAGAGQLDINSTLEAAIDSTVFSIPLEVNTSARLFWVLNFNAGLGVDLSVGSSELGFIGLSDIYSPALSQNVGTMTITGSTDEGPSFVRPRITGGFGLNLGPVALINFNATYYLLSGVSLNVSTGIVW